MAIKSKLTLNKVKDIIKENGLTTTDKIISFLTSNQNNYSYYDLSKIAENANQLRTKNSAYYTDEELLEIIEKELPSFEEDEINILEPSVGVGNFIPLLLKRYKDKKITLDVIDIDGESLKILKALLKLLDIPKTLKVNYHTHDFCSWKPNRHYHLAIGNPPFSKIRKGSKILLENSFYFANMESSNLASYFYEKCTKIADSTCMVLPKNILNTPEFSETRKYLSNLNINAIIDFGEKGFKGVLVETICIIENKLKRDDYVKVFSVTKDLTLSQTREYIFDDSFPYWIIYRNKFFDNFVSSLKLGVFDSFRDRQITDSYCSRNPKDIRIVKSRNISNDGQSLISIPGYDDYISEKKAKDLLIYKYLNTENVYLTPNMTYNVRVMRKPKGVLLNGSVAILIPKEKYDISNEDLKYFSTKEYREYMQIARNYQTRTLNVDSTSVYFYGLKVGGRPNDK